MNSRFNGLDFIRIVAAFAVIQVHAPFGPSVGGSFASTAASYVAKMEFNVSFFLAAAFLFFPLEFGARGLILRLRRLLIPFFCWSCIYFALRLLKVTLMHATGAILTDFVDLLISGGGSVHLYFLLILSVGTLTACLLLLCISKFPSWGVGFLSCAALSLYAVLGATGNDFYLGNGLAFTGWLGDQQTGVLRLLAVMAAWVIRILPYFLVILTLRRCSVVELARQKSPYVLAGSLLLFFGELFFKFIPGTPHEVVLGCSLVVIGLAMEPWLRPSALVSALGRWSFGIYLCHFVFVQLIQQVALRLGVSPVQTSLFVIISIAMLTFIFSAALCALVERLNFSFLNVVFGLPSPKKPKSQLDAGLLSVGKDTSISI